MRAIAKTQTKCGQIMLALLLVMMGFVLNMTPAQAGGGKKPGVPTVMSPPAKPKAPPSKASPPKKVVPPLVAVPSTPVKQCRPVYRDNSPPPDAGQYLPDVYLPSCCCLPLNVSSLYISPSGGVLSTLQYDDCE